ncbi:MULTISPECIES: PP2C family protein-serine/threonine phosphatase [Bacillaceae]|uniref:Protein phosphatase 2C domain-containing protein n=1 Tax=Evansella alkalicola TaxID=745819 RepID=A0ABS6K2J9_9BACI|nr:MULTISPECIES: protein phosphatase 2C domain-containing protein [Bacillaceae]MBU9724260.1 protein phosphatase 2C domain-containing protein [Bacillus alkalicola]
MTQSNPLFHFGLTTHCGTVKTNNEDNAFLKMDHDHHGNDIAIMLVADGMGGYHAGDLASQFVVDSVNNWWEGRRDTIFHEIDPLQSISQEISAMLEKINDTLIEESRGGRKTGTTISLLVLYKQHYVVCHVGDSRIYQLTNTASSSKDEGKAGAVQHHDETEDLLAPTEAASTVETGETVETEDTGGTFDRAGTAGHESIETARHAGRADSSHMGRPSSEVAESLKASNHYEAADTFETADLFQDTETMPFGKIELLQLTEDHSWVQKQVKLGLLQPEEAENHPKRNILLQCLGVGNGIVPYIRRGFYDTSDLFLLCSDGFHNMFSKEELGDLIFSLVDTYGDKDLQVLSDYLVKLANDRGAYDNVTVGLIQPALASEDREADGYDDGEVDWNRGGDAGGNESRNGNRDEDRKGNSSSFKSIFSNIFKR